MTRTDHTLHSLPGFPIYSLAFISPTKVLCGGGGGQTKSGVKNKLRLYEIQLPNFEIKLLDELELESGEDAPMTMAASVDERVVCGINSVQEKAAAGQNRNCRLYSVSGDKIVPEITQQTITSTDIEIYQKVTTFSPDEKYVAAGSTNNEVALLDFPSLRPSCKSIKLSEGDLYDVSISKTHILLTSSAHIVLYPLPKGKKPNRDTALSLVKQLSPPELHGRVTSGKLIFRAARFSPTEENVLFTVVNPSTAARSRAKENKEPVNSYICRWDTATWTVKRTRVVDKKPITVFDVSTDGKLLAWGSSDLKVGVLDSKTLAPVLTILRAHEFPPTALKFSADARLLVSASADSTVRVIAVPERRPSTTFPTTTVMIVALLLILLAILVQQYR